MNGRDGLVRQFRAWGERGGGGGVLLFFFFVDVGDDNFLLLFDLIVRAYSLWLWFGGMPFETN